MPGHTTQLKRRYGFNSTPTAVVLRPDGSEMDRIVGSNDRAVYLAKLRAIIERG